MNQVSGNVSDFPSKQPPVPSSASGGDDGGSGRLAAVESRLAALETHVKYLATKEDIQKIKVWVLAGVLGGSAIAVGLTATVIKLFFS